jgi:hypothetical protein
MQSTIGLHEPALVSPQDFLDCMTLLWSAPFNMKTTPAWWMACSRGLLPPCSPQ